MSLRGVGLGEVKRRRLSDLSRRVLELVTDGTHVPFLRMTHTYGMSNTTVRRHVRGLAGLKVLGKSRCIVSPRGVKCRAYTCVNLCLGSPRRFSSIARTLGGVPRIMRYRFAAKRCSVFVGVCTGGGRRLLDVVRSGLRPLNLTHSRAVVSFGRTVGERVPVLSLTSRSWSLLCPTVVGGAVQMRVFFVYQIVFSTYFFPFLFLCFKGVDVDFLKYIVGGYSVWLLNCVRYLFVRTYATCGGCFFFFFTIKWDSFRYERAFDSNGSYSFPTTWCGVPTVKGYSFKG